jgi:hypothetical protein
MYEQLTMFDPTTVYVLEAGPGEVWVQCLECREFSLRTRLQSCLRQRCRFCHGQVSVYIDGGPKPKRKRESRTQVRGEGL